MALLCTSLELFVKPQATNLLGLSSIRRCHVCGLSVHPKPRVAVRVASQISAASLGAAYFKCRQAAPIELDSLEREFRHHGTMVGNREHGIWVRFAGGFCPPKHAYRDMCGWMRARDATADKNMI